MKHFGNLAVASRLTSSSPMRNARTHEGVKMEREMKDSERRDFMRNAAIATAALVAGGADLAIAGTLDNPTKAQRPIRRIVTGHDANGRSRFIMDGAPPHALQKQAGDVIVTEVWMTAGVPVDNSGAVETVDGPYRLVPPPGGSIFRLVDFPPEAEYRAALARDLAAGDDGGGIVTALREGRVGRSVGFHRTNTLDYAIVISGEIYALMDDGERLLGAGDVLVQRGTIHAWENRSKTITRVAFVIIDAKSAV